MNVLVLSRKQIEQLSALMAEYTGEDSVTLEIDSGSGIGCHVAAIVKYASGSRQDYRDITDLDMW